MLYKNETKCLLLVLSIILASSMAFASLNLIAVSDAYADQYNPAQNYGASLQLRSGKYNGNAMRAYLKFNLSEIPPSADILGANLYLMKVGGQYDTLVSAHFVANSTWQEAAITWNNKPVYDASVIGSTMVTASAGWYSIDITPGMIQALNRSESLFSLMLKMDNESIYNNYKIFDSKEAFNKPYIRVLTSDEMHAPVIGSITAPDSVNEGELINVSFNASDVDGNINYYRIYINGYLVSLGNSVEWVADYADAGTYNYTFYVNDTTGLSASASRIVTVNNVPNVVINEVMPMPADSSQEWIELYNPLNVSVDLTDCRLWVNETYYLTLIGSIEGNAHDVLANLPEADLIGNNSGHISLLCRNPYEPQYFIYLDYLAYGNYNDDNPSDNAPSGSYNKSIGRYPDGIDTGIDSEDFAVFDTPTAGSANIIPPAPDTTPPVISNLRNSTITENSAAISWDTDEPSTSGVYYNTNPDDVMEFGISVEDLTLMHNVSVRWLLSNTTYYYVAGSCDADGNCANSPLYSFRTMASTIDTAAPAPLVISVDGDALPPYRSSDSMTEILVDIGENGGCRMADSDNGYDGMADDVDCIGDGTAEALCIHPAQADGAYTVFIACRDSSNNKNSAENNLELSYEINTSLPLINDDLMPNSVLGMLRIDGEPVPSGTAYMIEVASGPNAGYTYVGYVDDANVPDFVGYGYGVFATGDQPGFSTGEGFTITFDNCPHTAAGTFVDGSIGDFTGDEYAFILSCDTIGPNITNVYITPADPDEDSIVNVYADVYDYYGGLSDVFVFFSLNNNGFIPMRMGYTTAWNAALGIFNRSDYVEYYVWANDSFGNPSQSPVYNFTVLALDSDGDGYSESEGDCNDDDIAINPAALELCNGIDDNCNGLIDEGFSNYDADSMADCIDLDDDNDNVPDADDDYPFDSSRSILGDINGDGSVSALDLIIVRMAFDTTPQDIGWNALYDVNGDGVISIFDLIIIRRRFT